MCFLFLFQASCTQKNDHNTSKTIPVPTNVYDVNRYHLKADSAHQLDFKIDSPYPNANIITFYSDFYKAKNWSVCKGDNEWREYDKGIDKEAATPIRQKLQYLASAKEKKLLLIALRYFGKKDPSVNKTRKWGNNTQHVVVALYDLQGDSFEETISTLSLDCKSN